VKAKEACTKFLVEDDDNDSVVVVVVDSIMIMPIFVKLLLSVVVLLDFPDLDDTMDLGFNDLEELGIRPDPIFMYGTSTNWTKEVCMIR
jgi:hypothetical protein